MLKMPSFGMNTRPDIFSTQSLHHRWLCCSKPC